MLGPGHGLHLARVAAGRQSPAPPAEFLAPPLPRDARAAAAALLARVFAADPGFAAERWQAELAALDAAADRLLLVREGGEAVAVALLLADDAPAEAPPESPIARAGPWLSGLAVAPERRHRGLGTALVAHAAAAARTGGAQELHILTRAPRWFARRGFRPRGRTRVRGRAARWMALPLG